MVGRRRIDEASTATNTSCDHSARKRKHSKNQVTPPKRGVRRRGSKNQGENSDVQMGNNGDVEVVARPNQEIQQLRAEVHGMEQRIVAQVVDNITKKLGNIIKSEVKSEVQVLVQPLLPPLECDVKKGGTPLSGLTAKTIEAPKESREALRSFLRFRIYPNVKFITDEQAQKVLRVGRDEKKVDENINSPKQVQLEMSNLRQNSRAGAKSSYIGKFLGVVGSMAIFFHPLR